MSYQSAIEKFETKINSNNPIKKNKMKKETQASVSKDAIFKIIESRNLNYPHPSLLLTLTEDIEDDNNIRLLLKGFEATKVGYYMEDILGNILNVTAVSNSEVSISIFKEKK